MCCRRNKDSYRHAVDNSSKQYSLQTTRSVHPLPPTLDEEVDVTTDSIIFPTNNNQV